MTHVVAELAFPFLDKTIPLRLNQGRCFDGLVVPALSPFSPFLILDIFGKPTVVSVLVTSVELVDGVTTGVVSVDGTRAYLLFFPRV